MHKTEVRRTTTTAATLGDQTLKDWSSSDKTSSEGEARRVSAASANQCQQFVTPDDGRKFTELYNVQHLNSAQLDRVSRVCISTIQRLYSMLRWFFFWIETLMPRGQITRGDVASKCFLLERNVLARQ